MVLVKSKDNPKERGWEKAEDEIPRRSEPPRDRGTELKTL